MLDPQTRQSLASLLEQARASYAEHAARNSLPLLAERTRPVVRRDDGVWTSVELEQVVENGLRHWPGGSFVGALNERAQAQLLQLGAELRRMIGGHRPDWLNLVLPLGSLEPPGATDEEYRRDREGYWWTALVFQVVWSYLHGLRSLEEPDEGLAQRLIAELSDVLLNRRVTFQTKAAIAGIDVAEPEIAFGPITIRKLSPVEKAVFVEYAWPGRSMDSDLLVHPKSSQLPTHALQVTVTCGWETQPRDNLTTAVLLALTLKGCDIYVPAPVTSSLLPAWLGSRQGRWLNLDRPPRSRTAIDSAALQSVHEIATKVIKYNFEAPQSGEELALHRFLLGCGRNDDTDAMLDFMIVLEAVLLPGISQEVSFRFRLNGALWLGEEVEERRRMLKQLKDLYDGRSRAVHGEMPSTPQDRVGAAQSSRELASRALLKALHGGFPTRSAFEDLALGLVG